MFQVTWLLVPLVAPAFLLPPILWVLLSHRDHPRLSVYPVVALATAATLWSLSDAVRVALTDESLKQFAYNGYFLFGSIVVVTLYLFAADYSDNRRWRSVRRSGPLFGAFFVTTAIEVTNFRDLAARSFDTVVINGVVFLEPDWGAVFYVHHALAYLILGIAAYMFLSYEKSHRHYRGQVASILLAMTVPWLLNMAYLAGQTRINYTGVGFAVAIPVAALMIFRYRILDIVPIARSVVVDEMGTGFVVLDRADTVVDINDRAASILDADPEAVLGLSREELVASVPELGAAFDEGEQTTFEVVEDGETRHFQAEVSRISDTMVEYRGAVVVLQDVTELVETQSKLEERTRVLERQNERLDDFAHMVSHDLRNPLAIAQGQLQLARDQTDNEHLRKVHDAQARIDELIDDVLTLARQGQAVTERERVPLDRVAREAWHNVDTDRATLTVDTDTTVAADESRLSQLFENLFRNAVEHGGPAVTVTVGDRPDGFYVADDGPGIPPEDRDDVLQKGYTTADDGTGFGLSIVSAVVEAHGWTVDVTESDAGGARFEVTGVVAEQEGTTDVGPTA